AVHGSRFEEFLKRAMLHAAPVNSPADVAWFLASYAREARARVEGQALPALDSLRMALEKALGITFEGSRGNHFFRSTLVQTLFYGVFSAWVLWHQANPARRDTFDWRSAAWELHVPMLQALFAQLAMPQHLKPLRLAEVLSLAGALLNRVERERFFANFEEAYAVQYFYEPFLEAFDPELRKALGVWYTPPEIVRYQVERVDQVLRDELGLPDGLADERVYILDPACGTGAYLVEVLKRIGTTLAEQGEEGLIGATLKQAVQSRVFGFELLPAPFVVAHLQLGLLLQRLGAPLDEEQERAGVYLTNSLTGWKAGAEQGQSEFPELDAEGAAANSIKRDAPILVVLGNPPYNAFAGVSPQEEKGLVRPYKEGLIDVWGIKKFNLDELYVRFFGLAERRIAEMTGMGVVSYISNFSYLSEPSFVVMRQRLLAGFDKLWFDNLNGDSRETGKRTPEGLPDPSVFSTEYNREGIRKGTAICLLVRKAQRAPLPQVYYREFWGTRKKQELLESLTRPNLEEQYDFVAPVVENRLVFRATDVTDQYLEWPLLSDLAAVVLNGLMEKRGGALFAIDPAALERRMRLYYDRTVDWETLDALDTGLTKDAAGFEARKVRPKVQAAEPFQQERLCRYALRPFDTRYCYYSDVSPLWNRSRPPLWEQFWEGNSFLISRPKGVASPEGIPFSFTRVLGDNDFLRGHAYYIPLLLRRVSLAGPVFQSLNLAGDSPATANLSEPARRYLGALGIADIDADPDSALLLWLHALAIGYSPAYLAEHEDGIRMDWPRIPLPAHRDLLLDSAALGQRVAALLDTERALPGVTTGSIEPALRPLAVIARAGGGALDPNAGHLTLTAGWGYPSGSGVMPGRGDARPRDYSTAEREAIAASAATLGLSEEEALARLGSHTYDIYLNDLAHWRNIPATVWGYTIGGYQVLKKWLSYRDERVLGRSLTIDEAQEVREIARRLTALLLLTPALDINYVRIKAETWTWAV
nr:N-6 DNA methylase [Ardenticatenales bacterium]